MKYFTRQQYEKMQVWGHLVFPEDEEQYKEFHDIRYEEIYKKNFEDMKPYLIKYLPDRFTPYIHDGSLVQGQLLKQPLKSFVQEWQSHWNQEWDGAVRQYSEYYRTIKDRLPLKPEILSEVTGFHDSRIIRMEFPAADCVKLSLDCKGAFTSMEACDLVFEGVKSSEIPLDLVSDRWLYEELYLLNENLIELRVLLDSSRGYMDTNELIIRAENIEITNIVERTDEY